MVSHTGYNWLIFVKIHDWLVQRSWTLWTPRVPHIHKLFFINFRGVVCACKFISSWQLFAEWTKCHVYTWFRSGDWYCQNKAPEVNSFSRECYQVPPPPCFWGESLGTRLLLQCHHLHSQEFNFYFMRLHCLGLCAHAQTDWIIKMTVSVLATCTLCAVGEAVQISKQIEVTLRHQEKAINWAI